MQPGQEPDADGAAGGRLGPAPRSRRRALGEGRRWLSEPRSVVVVVLGGVVALGGGWKLLQAWKTRRLVARLGEPDVTPDEVEAAAACGRAGLPELFRLLGEAQSAELRAAAARSIALLWARDELIAEEEQALVRRAYEVSWKARRRYPRALRIEIPIAVHFGASFLSGERPGISAENLEWSYRVSGARRAALEGDSGWQTGARPFSFSIVPGDFETSGPHRLAFHATVRTRGLTDAWQVDLPAVPFSFELDPRLDVTSLLTLPDDARGEDLARRIRLERAAPAGGQSPRFLVLDAEMTLRDPPVLAIDAPLPCDLAHRLSLEFDGIAGRFAAGAVVLGGQGGARQGEPSSSDRRSLPIEAIDPNAADQIDRPGPRRLRAILEPDPELGWTDPDIRSIWPGTITTDWCEAEVVRR